MFKKLILEVKDLAKIFPNGKIANEDINIQVFEGECIGLLGGNGAGKTTLVEQIAGLITPTFGSIKFYFDYSYTPKEKIGIQFQQSSYPDGLTTKDVIQLQLDMYQVKITYKELDDLLEVFQIKDFYYKKASSLSGGQLQKINVLLALIHSPKFVILDELTTALDIFAREEIFQYVEKFIKEKKVTTLLISHNMNEIERLCDRIIVLLYGKISFDGTLKELQKKYGSLSDYMVNVISEAEKIETIKRENKDVTSIVNKKLKQIVSQKIQGKKFKFPSHWEKGQKLKEEDLRIYGLKIPFIEDDEKLEIFVYKIRETKGEILIKFVLTKEPINSIFMVLKINGFITPISIYVKKLLDQPWNGFKKEIPQIWKVNTFLEQDELLNYGLKDLTIPEGFTVKFEILRIKRKLRFVEIRAIFLKNNFQVDEIKIEIDNFAKNKVESEK